MSHLWNLLRDQTHVLPTTVDGPGWRGHSALGNRTILANTNPTVFQDFGTVDGALENITGADWHGSGMYISQPSIDATPYRVKCKIMCETLGFIVVGYGPSAPTGDDAITKTTLFPVTSPSSPVADFDEVIKMPGLPTTSSDADKPIFFGVLIRRQVNADAAFHMSVQNLSRTPPTFSASTS